MSRAAPQSAYVLHQWAWSETSAILDLFTRERGRVAAVARGAKRPYSQLRSVLLPFQGIQVTLSRSRADGGGDDRLRADDGDEVLTLRSAEFGGGSPVLPAERLLTGFYLNELLMKLLARHDPHPHLFDTYADAIDALAAVHAGDDEPVLRAFELALLRETGVLPELDRCTVTQQPLRPDRGYVLRPEAGLVAAGAGETSIPASTCLALHAALSANDLAALREASAGALPVLKTQLRAVLHYHLGSTPLRTRQAMIDLRRLFDPPPDDSVR